MEHKIMWATWKSASSLEKAIRERESEGWGVVGMGEVFGGSILVLLNDGNLYRHKIIQIFWSLKDRLTEIVEQEQEEGWVVAALGECLGSTLLVLKRIVSQPENTAD
jgi:hypothetical protein